MPFLRSAPASLLPLAVCFLLGALARGPLPAAAQSATTSAVRGSVVTDGGRPLPDATVTIRHGGTGAVRRLATTGDGRFMALLLPPGGPYSVEVTSLGYGTARRRDIRLQVGEVHVMEVVLTEEAVEVEGLEVEVERDEIFNPGQVGPATLLDEGFVESVPVLSRNVMELAALSPLVRATGDGGFSVAGQNTRYNAILVDGLANKDAFGLTAGGTPGGQAGAKLVPLDAVAQYEVLVAPFDVRLSGFTGGVMNAVTRTGTNDWWVRGFGVHRNEALIGDLNLPTGPVEASGVDRALLGLSVGGPLVEDRAHFFVSGEWERRRQPPVGYNLLRDDPLLIRIAPDAAARAQERLEALGLEPGLAGPFPLDQELTNVFARLDWDLGGGHRMTLRNVYAGAANDESPNRAFFDPYELSSNGVFRESVNNVTSLQLFSALEGGAANELQVTVQRTLDRSAPESPGPQVEVDVRSAIAGGSWERRLRAGGEFFAHENDLEQTTVRITDALSLSRGDNNFTWGVTGAWYGIRHRYLPGARGDWFFAALADLEANAPQRYQRAVLAEGADAAVSFDVLEWGAFAQNRIDAGEGLTLRLGIRVDMPHVLDTPPENPEVLELFGHSTAHVPSGQLMVSPRFGFNWQSEGRLTTQVRGGGGVFVGQLPFAWLSNAFQNDGLRWLTRVCRGRHTDDPLTGNTAPRFQPGASFDACLAGPFEEVRTVTMFEEGFKYPQDFRVAATVDQELTSRLSGTLGVLFNHAVNQVSLEELNLGDPSSRLGPLDGYGGPDRRYFGRPAAHGFEPTFEHPEYDQVLLARNEGDDWAFSVSAELRGRVVEGVAGHLGYSFSRSWDRASLTSVDMVANYGTNAIARHPNQPLVDVSAFDRPHKVVASVFGTPFPGLPDTHVSLLYTGQSGLPFSYVYRGDVNGDGYPGLGPALDRMNDLLYVPDVASEVPSGFATQALLAEAIRTDACLARWRGRIMRRNSCRSPFQHRLDLRVAQTLVVGEASVRLEGDLINVLNLLNGDWGTVETVPSTVPLLEVRRGGFLSVPPMFATWGGGVLPDRDEDGRLEATDPYSVLSPDSQWQAQLGVRVTFGGR